MARRQATLVVAWACAFELAAAAAGAQDEPGRLEIRITRAAGSITVDGDTSAVNRKDGDFTGSALLAYKLNWQTVMFLGYGDNRTLDTNERWAKAGRQFFLKLSYAFQR